MPFTSGTANCPSQLLKALNDHLVANGWTKLRGEADMACASPKAARYWRFLMDPSNNNTAGVQKISMAATPGGANIATNTAAWSANNVGTGSPSTLVAGGTAFRTVPNAFSTGGIWVLKYDFGTPTTVEEVKITGDSTASFTPRRFLIQWSNDNITWTTMFGQTTLLTWAATETKTFTFGAAYLYSRHYSANDPCRSGSAELISSETFNSYANTIDTSEDVWAWQGPGFDATRRTYIWARGHQRELNGSAEIEFNYSTSYDPLILNWGGQTGFYTSGNSLSHLMINGPVSYWIYSNSSSFILITRSGAQDYTSTYAGFLSGFGTPDNYPFPLAILTTSPYLAAFDYTSGDTSLGSCTDPGINSALCKLWDDTDFILGNRLTGSSTNLYSGAPANGWVWPIHTGTTDRAAWPGNWAGDYADYSPGHAFDYFVATAQGNLPMFPATIQHTTYGNIGALQNVFVLPSGSLLSPTQTLTIGTDTYRIFPNRTRRGASNWFAVLEA